MSERKTESLPVHSPNAELVEKTRAVVAQLRAAGKLEGDEIGPVLFREMEMLVEEIDWLRSKLTEPQGGVTLLVSDESAKSLEIEPMGDVAKHWWTVAKEAHERIRTLEAENARFKTALENYRVAAELEGSKGG